MLVGSLPNENVWVNCVALSGNACLAICFRRSKKSENVWVVGLYFA